MPYQITKPEVDALGKALDEYYEEAWQEGIKGLFNNMARSNMGLVTGYLDQAQDTYASLRKKSNDKFGITFRPALKQFVSVYLANKNDVASALVSVAESALKQLAKQIPVPHLGSLVAQGISFAAAKGQEELHKRSVAEADSQLNAKTNAEVGKFFTSDAAAADFIQKSIDQYKLICKYIQTLPATPSSFDDTVAFPGAVFKVQAASSSLNVALVSVRQYLAGMQERLEKIQTVSKDYIVTVRKDMPAAVGAVLQSAYTDAYRKGEGDIAQKKYSAPRQPVFLKPTQPGGATQLAAYMANAVAQGYYDAGNRGPQIGLPRASSGAPPPRPGFPPMPPVRR
ncbi:MAG: hypothetical protein ACRD3F_10535 [Acidobacteriaceae bacterium]